MASGLAHDVSRELRDPHSGKWSKGGQVLDRLEREASGGHERTLAQVHSVKPGGGKQVNGHWVDRPESEGGKFRVKLKKPGERGRDTRTYASAEDAASALHTGSHGSPATERAARDVTATSRPSAPAGPPSRPEKPSESVRTVTARDLKPGMVVSSGHWQAPSGPHEITKLEKSGAGSSSGGVRYSSGIYHTASTHIHHKDGQYQVSNNTKFKVHKEAPSGPQNTRRIEVQSGTANVRNINIPQSGAKEPGTKAPVRGLPPGYSAHYAPASDPGLKGDKGKPNIEIWSAKDGHVATLRYRDYLSQKRGRVGNISVGSYRTTGYTYELKHPDVKAAHKEAYQTAIRQRLHGGRPNPGSDLEAPQGRAAADAIKDHEERLARARGEITPAQRQQMNRIQAIEKARVEAENKGRGGVTIHSGPMGGVGDKPDIASLNAQWQAARDRWQKAALPSQSKAAQREMHDIESRLKAVGAAFDAKTGWSKPGPVPATRYNGALITSMSDAQLRNAAKKPGSPQEIKDEIARRYRQAKLKEIGHVRG